MGRTLRAVLLGVGGALVLAACASNAEIAATRCAGVAGQAGVYDGCVARELDRLAVAQAAPRPARDGGGY